jgi:hypothetical protein
VPYNEFLLSLIKSSPLSRDVPADIGLLRDKAAVFGVTTKETLYLAGMK